MAIIYGPPTWKPPQGTLLSPSAGLARGLLYFAPCWEGAGATITDCVRGLSLPLNVPLAAWGTGLSCGTKFTANNSFIQATAPTYLQVASAVTVAMGFRYAASGFTASSTFGGVTYSNSSNPPYYGYGFQWNGAAAQPLLCYNLGGTFASLAGGTLTAGLDYVVSGSVTSGAQALYTNGAIQASATGTGSITYQSTGVVCLGGTSIFGNRQSNLLCYWMGIWARVLSAGEHAELARNPWQIFAPRVSIANFGSGATTAVVTPAPRAWAVPAESPWPGEGMALSRRPPYYSVPWPRRTVAAAEAPPPDPGSATASRRLLATAAANVKPPRPVIVAAEAPPMADGVAFAARVLYAAPSALSQCPDPTQVNWARATTIPDPTQAQWTYCLGT